MSKQNIILGDAIEQMSEMESDSYNLIIADPPYNLGKAYGNNNDSLNFNEYLEFSQKWLSQAYRVLKSSGTIYVFMGFRFISYVYKILSENLDMHFNSWIVWHYTQGIGRTKGFSPRHDDILMFTKSTDFTFNLDDVRVPQKYYRNRNNMRGANPGDVWQFSHVHYCNGNRQAHPTQKPEGLMERMILASSGSGDKILDPFLGSGTTLRVCQQLDRYGTGIEVNPSYVEVAKRRLQQPFTGFDSVDPRMKRIPKDLRDKIIRDNYLHNHKKWFLSNHENEIEEFKEKVTSLYNENEKSYNQQKLFEEEEEYYF